MRTRLTALILTLVLTLSLVPIAAQAASGTVQGGSWTYENGLLTLQGTGTVTCPDQFETPWWDGDFSDAIHTIVVKEGVTALTGELFQTCSNVDHLYLPSSIRELGYSVFFYPYTNGLNIYYPGSAYEWGQVSVSPGSLSWLRSVNMHYYTDWNNGMAEVPSAGTILPNFSPYLSYIPGQFTDVNASEWYADSVRQAYSFGLMNGMSETTFAPKGNLTVAQVVTIAARLHSTYYNNRYVFTQTQPWYKTYTDYAVDKGMVRADTNFDALCTRSTFAAILYSAVASKEFTPINQVNRIPDIHKADWYTESVYNLYHAGVLQGNDKYGSFAPNSNITRGETAAILSRIVDKSLRVDFTLETPNYTLTNPYTSKTFYGPSGKSISLWHADSWEFYYNNYQGDFSGMPKVTTRYNSLDMVYGSEADRYSAYFYVHGREQIVVCLVNNLTGDLQLRYMYNLYNASDDFVGLRLTNVFDKSDHLYMYLTTYWDRGNYAFTQVIPASYYD